MTEILPIHATGDLSALHALNEAHALELSSLSHEKFAAMIGEAFYARAIDPAKAFLLAFDQNADYDSENFLWFKARYDRFVYVDRIVVSPHARGRGLARKLYEDLFAAAKEAGHERIVCEINIDPPNPVSDKFHQAMGFEMVGRAKLTGKNKVVGYFARKI